MVDYGDKIYYLVYLEHGTIEVVLFTHKADKDASLVELKMRGIIVMKHGDEYLNADAL